MSKGDDTQTQVVRQELPSWLQAEIPPFTQAVRGVVNQPYQPPPFSRVAGITPEQELGLDLTTARALSGSPLLQQSSQLLGRTLQGDYLSPTSNPGWGQGLDDVVSAYQRGIAPQTDAMFSRSGAFGGSAHQEVVQQNQRQLADALTRQLGDQYQQERQRQMQSLFFAPQLAQTDYQDINALIGAGDVRRTYAQQLLDQGYQNFLEQRAFPQQMLDLYGTNLSRIAGYGGGSQTSTGPNPNQGSPIAGGIGGALSGASLASMLGTPAAPFALLGGALGLFS